MLRLDRHGPIARLVLDRPAVRNAVPLAGWDELAARIDEAVFGGARLLVLEGAGGAFSAGADLGDFAEIRAREDGPAGFRAAMKRATDRLATAPIPAIAAIAGPCYGAGVALAMACDVRVAAPEARFAITPAKMGISYPQEDVARLVGLVGAGQAARLLFTGAAIDAAEAARIGLVELVGGGETVDALASAMLANAGESLNALKAGIRAAAAGRASDAGQDAAFDALIASDGFGDRLDAVRRK